MQRPPGALPNRLRVVGLLAFDQFGNFPPENIGDRSSVAAHGVSISDSFRVFGIAKANGNQLKRGDLSVRTVAQGQGERDPVKTGFDVLDQGHSLPTLEREEHSNKLQAVATWERKYASVRRFQLLTGRPHQPPPKSPISRPPART